MSTQTSFDLIGLSRAIQARDCRYHLALYADDADVEIVDDAQPGAPLQVLRGKAAIGHWLDAMSSAAVSYQVRDAVAHRDRVTYTEECRYADGSRLLFECDAQVRRGQISHAVVKLVHLERGTSLPRLQRPRPASTAGSPTGRRRTSTHSGHERSQNLAGNFLG